MTGRDGLIAALKNHVPFNEEEERHVSEMIRFITEEADCFERSLIHGHLTGSAWITDETLSKCVLVHHRKLNRWLQPGGHADGETNILEVARKEAIEETGLWNLRSNDRIFDVDIHLIPANSRDAAHFHYDVRIHFIASGDDAVTVSGESHDVAWIPMDKVKELSGDESSIARMVDKCLSGYKKQ